MISFQFLFLFEPSFQLCRRKCMCAQCTTYRQSNSGENVRQQTTKEAKMSAKNKPSHKIYSVIFFLLFFFVGFQLIKIVFFISSHEFLYLNERASKPRGFSSNNNQKRSTGNDKIKHIRILFLSHLFFSLTVASILKSLHESSAPA